VLYSARVDSEDTDEDASKFFRTLKTWQASFGTPTGSLLGIFNAIQSIGGIAGLPFAPFFSDRYGRRMTMFLGACSKYALCGDYNGVLATEGFWLLPQSCASVWPSRQLLKTSECSLAAGAYHTERIIQPLHRL
jgi:MFS family permease